MQINEDRDWEALYRADDTFWDHGEASPGLVDYLNVNYSPLEELIEDIPYDDWFWYDIRLLFLIRNENKSQKINGIE